MFLAECFVNVSTDKAADPTSVLGRTKLEAERLTAAKAATASGNFMSVRFGNVLGSRGSVLPIFRHQIAQGGPITVTHPDVTRYFMTIPEAVRLVLQAGAIGRPGEVMILDMGEPVKIVDLAEQLIRHFGADVDIQFTGLRPGEKMDEVLVSQTEQVQIREHPRIMHATPHTERA
ncbi:MAG: polysaccharide biosynthesis protein [Acidimicrobiales bacterium]